MTTPIHMTPAARLTTLSLALLLGWNAPAWAGVSYSLDRNHASAGETVLVRAVVFNDTPNALDWTAPPTIVLQWRNERGEAIRSIARLHSGAAEASIPVNNFARFEWRAVVPQAAVGLQAVNVEGDTTLLALDTSPTEAGKVVASRADGPVLDASKGDTVYGDPIAASDDVARAGSSHAGGPVPVAALGGQTNPGFERFRSAISPYEAVYFDVGGHGSRTARFQISLKYRLFTPQDPQNPGFLDNLYVGYTQTSLWDLHSDSHPFVDTSFKPSVFWRQDALYRPENSAFFLGLQAGVEHESNGKSGDDSRALNFLYIQPEFNYRMGHGSTLTFAPRVKQYFSDSENPDYRDYVGNVDWKLRWAQDDGLVLTGLYRHGKGGRNSTQLEAAWPLKRTFLNMNGYFHVQYFKGYNETLLGYDQKTGSQLRFGLALVP
ncbi:MAG TPA: phospholipase A [Burkholderiaceae bacterium]|nr:phospholipase A [Burkholderiaceae bacterium]